MEELLFQVFEENDTIILEDGFLKTNHIPASEVYFDVNVDLPSVYSKGGKMQIGFTATNSRKHEQHTRLYLPSTFEIKEDVAGEDCMYYKMVIPENGDFEKAIKGLASLVQYPHPLRIKKTDGWNFSEVDFPGDFDPKFKIIYFNEELERKLRRL